VDLRAYSGESKDGAPTIEQLLADVIERSWKLSNRSITPQEVLRLVREEGAVILFDGLDEKIVHLPPKRALEPQLTVALRSLEAILGGEAPRMAVFVFAYWLRAL
jgi:hypothetical protein